MAEFKIFEVIIERSVDPESLDWPELGEASEDSGLSGNREYGDLRRLSWSEARRVFEEEGGIVARLESAADLAAELQAVEDEEVENSDVGLYGLDVGIASTVVALSAAKCIPASSCNGGTFGDFHAEEYPLVAFYCRQQHVPYLLECAETAMVGLVDNSGLLVVYAADIRQMRIFAQALYEKRSQIPKSFGLRHKAKLARVNPSKDQLKLF